MDIVSKSSHGLLTKGSRYLYNEVIKLTINSNGTVVSTYGGVRWGETFERFKTAVLLIPM